MFITKKSLPRRTFLRGVGASLALPLLDSMIPARTLLAQTAAKPVSRLGFVYVPHGAIMDKWTPATVGAGLRVHADPQAARALPRSAERRQRPRPSSAADTTAVHSLSPTTWLSGVRPKATQGVDAFAGVTADQIAAQAIGQDTPLPSMELATEDHSGPHRLVRSRLRLHLHEHAVVADAGNAAADGDQSAQGLRADVRPGRQRRRARWRAFRRTAASSTRSRGRRRACSCSSGRPIARR